MYLTKLQSIMVGVSLLVYVTLAAAVEPVLTKLGNFENAQNRIKIVFVAEGYTQAQQSKFISLTNKVIGTMLTTVPFKYYPRFFQFYSVWAPSNQSGISNDIVKVDNYWGGYSCGICTCIKRENDLINFLNTNLADWTIAIVIYRDDEKRGLHTCADRITLTPDRVVEQGSFIETEAVSVMIHEFGHTLANLADEHELLTGGGANAPLQKRAPTLFVRNTVGAVSNWDALPWRAWVNPKTPIPTPDTGIWKDSIGAFLAKTAGFYRPRLQCKMRNLYKEFCEVCREGLILSFYQYSGPVDSFLPKPGVCTLSTKTQFTAKILPNSGTIKTQWFLDNQPLPVSNATSFTFDPDLYSNQNHKLECVAQDTSPMIRIYKDNLIFSSKATWDIKLGQTAVIVKKSTSFQKKAAKPEVYLLLNGKCIKGSKLSEKVQNKSKLSIKTVKNEELILFY